MWKLLKSLLRDKKLKQQYEKFKDAKEIINELRASNLLNKRDAELFLRLLRQKWLKLTSLMQPAKLSAAADDLASAKHLLENYGNVFTDEDAKRLKAIGKQKLQIIMELLGLMEKSSPARISDRDTIRDFIQNFYHGDALSDKVAKVNLKQGLVELIWPDGQHLGCGLLITDNGYFLTCNHCINEDLSQISARLADGEVSRRVKLCAYSVKYDVALVKMELDGQVRARRYKFYQKLDYNFLNLQPLFSVSLVNGVEKIIAGVGQKVEVKTKIKNGKTYWQHLNCFLKSKKGDSGSVVTTADGRIVGLLSTGADDFNSGVATWNYFLELLSHFSY